MQAQFARSSWTAGLLKDAGVSSDNTTSADVYVCDGVCVVQYSHPVPLLVQGLYM